VVEEDILRIIHDNKTYLQIPAEDENYDEEIY